MLGEDTRHAGTYLSGRDIGVQQLDLNAEVTRLADSCVLAQLRLLKLRSQRIRLSSGCGDRLRLQLASLLHGLVHGLQTRSTQPVRPIRVATNDTAPHGNTREGRVHTRGVH